MGCKYKPEFWLDLPTLYSMHLMPISQIANMKHCSATRVQRKLIEMGIPLRNDPPSGRPPTVLDRKQITNLYLSGMVPSTIAPIFGVHSATIIRRLHKWGIPLRKQIPWNKGLDTSDPRVASNIDKALATRRVPENQQNIARRWRERCSDPQYWASRQQAMFHGRHARPNRPETKVIRTLQTHHLPFKYTGDGAVIIGGLNPDFINTNGAKQVIEVYGDYWHTQRTRTWRDTELGRIMAYRAYGFDCIVLWEHDIQQLSEDEIAGRIRNESRRVSHMHGRRAKG